jgi:flagellar biosynthetic protein FliR
MTVQPFDLFAPGSATVLILVATRVSGLVLVAPVFSAHTIPMPLRTAIVVLFTLLVQPAALAALPAAQTPALTPAALAGEAVIGLAMGLGAAVIVAAAEVAGDVMSVQMGLSGEAILNPLSHTQTTALGQFMGLFTVAVMVSLDMHLVMVGALADSVHLIPVGANLDLAAGLRALAESGATVFALGLRFAAPVIGAVMIVNVALAVLGRAAPQMNLLSVSFPLQIAVGLVALVGALPFIAEAHGGWRALFEANVSHTFAALARTGGR